MKVMVRLVEQIEGAGGYGFCTNLNDVRPLSHGGVALLVFPHEIEAKDKN
jgi:hypothetical protein